MTRASEIEAAAVGILNASIAKADSIEAWMQVLFVAIQSLQKAVALPSDLAVDVPPAVVWRDASDCPPAIWSQGSAGFSSKLWLKLESKGELYAMRGAAYWSDWDAGLIDWAVSRGDFTGDFKVMGWAPFLPPAV